MNLWGNWYIRNGTAMLVVDVQKLESTNHLRNVVADATNADILVEAEALFQSLHLCLMAQ